MAAKPNILVYSANEADKYADFLRSAGYTSISTATTPEEAAGRLAETEILFCWKFPTHLLTQPEAARLRWIQSMGAGVEDLVRDKKIPEDIVLTRIVGQFGAPIAEYVFAYLLYLCKNIPRMRRAQVNHAWDSFVPGTLYGKTIGVAGLGSIGSEIARKARAFDMKVHGLAFSGHSANVVDKHYTSREWKDFVQELDYLVLALPLTDETQYVVNRDVLFCMKRGAGLINIGRGKLIKETDLVEVIESGHLGPVILDVFEHEPLASDSLLWSLPNVYVTPHLSGPSIVESVSQFFRENLELYRRGLPLNGVVNRRAGY